MVVKKTIHTIHKTKVGGNFKIFSFIFRVNHQLNNNWLSAGDFPHFSGRYNLEISKT